MPPFDSPLALWQPLIFASGSEFSPLYSATISSREKCLTFSKAVLQESWQKVRAPKKCRPFVLGVTIQCMPSFEAFLDLLSLWTLGLCVCGSVAELFVCVILSLPSPVSFYSYYWNSHLVDVSALKEFVLKNTKQPFSFRREIQGKMPPGQGSNQITDELGRSQNWSP